MKSRENHMQLDSKEKKEEIQKNLIDLVESLSKRPAMYVGTRSLKAISHYLHGYRHALNDLGCQETMLDGWGRWLELKFMICSPAWHWTRILLHHYGSDESAIHALPSLLSEYLEKLDAVGLKGILEEHDKALRDDTGFLYREPKETTTSLEDWLSDKYA
jgi:hypothetical protein